MARQALGGPDFMARYTSPDRDRPRGARPFSFELSPPAPAASPATNFAAAVGPEADAGIVAMLPTVLDSSTQTETLTPTDPFHLLDLANLIQ